MTEYLQRNPYCEASLLLRSFCHTHLSQFVVLVSETARTGDERDWMSCVVESKKEVYRCVEILLRSITIAVAFSLVEGFFGNVRYVCAVWRC